MAELSPAAAPDKYFHNKPFVKSQIRTDFATKLGSDPRFNAASTNDLETLLSYIEADPRVTDVRWMAYMLATAYWETAHIEKIQKPVLDKKGNPAMKAGVPVVKNVKVWRNIGPATEVAPTGKYVPAVKVKRLADGTARVTEQDGNQWSVSASGVPTPLTKKAKYGALFGGTAVKAYTDDDGVELQYFGRGYVQLTWWYNYASTGVAIGRGLDLLFDPELVLDPAVAYELMARGLLTGAGFANGRKLSDYFQGELTDYKGARAMVNGSDHADDIAKIAKAFEEMLMENKVEPLTVIVGPLP
ncbi:MAG TPA: glycoside hydrolase family 19 protein [Gemmatimonadaceae bacterium]